MAVRRYHRRRGGLEARRAAGALPGLRGPGAAPDAAGQPAQARRRDARRQPSLGQGRRPRHRARPPGRRRQHRAAARLVRRGRHRGGHPVAALDRQPQPAPSASWRRCWRSSRTPSTRWPTSAAGGCTRSVRSTCCRPSPPRSSRRPRRPPATSTGCWSTSRSATAAAARSPTPSAPCSSEHAADGHLARGARPDHRRRAHRRAPLHQGPARSRPGDPHVGGAAARRASCSGRAPSRSSTSARPTGPTSGASTSCARSAPTPCASVATAPEARESGGHGSAVRRSPASRACRPGRSLRDAAYVRGHRRVGKLAVSGGPVVMIHDCERAAAPLAGRSRGPALRPPGTLPVRQWTEDRGAECTRRSCEG